MEIFFRTSDEHQALLMEMLPARVPLAQNMVQMSSATAWFWIMWWRHTSVKLWTWRSNYHDSALFSHKWALDWIEFSAKLCKCGSHSGTFLLLLEQFNKSNSKIKHVMSQMAVPTHNQNPLHLSPGQICSFQQWKKKGKKSNVTVSSLKEHLLAYKAHWWHIHSMGDQKTPKVAKQR